MAELKEIGEARINPQAPADALQQLERKINELVRVINELIRRST